MGCSLHVAEKAFWATAGLLPCKPLKEKRPSATDRRSRGKGADPATPAATSNALRQRTRRLFRLLAMTLLPAVALAGLELGLRLAGYGHPISFFVKTQINGRSVFVENDRFGERFFPRALARIPAPTLLSAEKPANTI